MKVVLAKESELHLGPTLEVAEADLVLAENFDGTWRAVKARTFDEIEVTDIREQRLVQVQFFGCEKTYTYPVNPTDRFAVGDIARAYSKTHRKWDLVKVVGLGRGSFQGDIYGKPLKQVYVGGM